MVGEQGPKFESERLEHVKEFIIQSIRNGENSQRNIYNNPNFGIDEITRVLHALRGEGIIFYDDVKMTYRMRLSHEAESKRPSATSAVTQVESVKAAIKPIPQAERKLKKVGALEVVLADGEFKIKKPSKLETPGPLVEQTLLFANILLKRFKTQNFTLEELNEELDKTQMFPSETTRYELIESSKNLNFLQKTDEHFSFNPNFSSILVLSYPKH